MVMHINYHPMSVAILFSSVSVVAYGRRCVLQRSATRVTLINVIAQQWRMHPRRESRASNVHGRSAVRMRCDVMYESLILITMVWK